MRVIAASPSAKLGGQKRFGTLPVIGTHDDLIISSFILEKQLSNATVYKVHTHIDTITCYEMTNNVGLVQLR